MATRAAARHMIRRGSGVILAFSGSGPHTLPGLGGFKIALDALEGFRRQWACELGQHGIRVVTIKTGGVPESIDASVAMREEITAAIERATLLNPSHSTRMRLFSSMAKTLTWVEASYISHFHWTSLPGSNLPLPLVNQNLEVMAGLINASKTSATGLRISIAVFATGICVSWRFSIDTFLSNDELLLTTRSC
jgi:hypothetical protein